MNYRKRCDNFKKFPVSIFFVTRNLEISSNLMMFHKGYCILKISPNLNNMVEKITCDTLVLEENRVLQSDI